MSEQAENESELVRSAATLEKRVAERTEELTRLNAALERANKAAEEANIGKTRFFAAASNVRALSAATLQAASSQPSLATSGAVRSTRPGQSREAEKVPAFPRANPGGSSTTASNRSSRRASRRSHSKTSPATATTSTPSALDSSTISASTSRASSIRARRESVLPTCQSPVWSSLIGRTGRMGPRHS